MKHAPIIVSLLLLLALFAYSGDPPQKETMSIAIQPFTGIEKEYVNEVKNALTKHYETDVTILPEIELPKSAFINVKSSRYRADKLLQFLRDSKPKTASTIIGLTHRDISTTKYEDFATGKVLEPKWKYEDWGVFGLGYHPGEACIVSTFRLKAKVDQKTILDRLRKIACHEIGHNLGLAHCANPACFMRDAAEKISTLDVALERLCPNCRKQVAAKYKQ